jgi:hypothetical protein
LGFVETAFGLDVASPRPLAFCSASLMSRRLIAGMIAAGVGTVVVGFLVWPCFPVLEIVDGRSGGVVFCARVQPGEEFVLSFVHSVNRRPVYDTLRVEADHLVILRSRFDSFGAGMPEASTQDGALSVGEDGWLEWTVNRPTPEITVRVGRVADHTVHYKGRDIRLSDLGEPGSALTLRVRKSGWLDLMKNRCIP